MRRQSRHILMVGADKRRLRPVFVVTGPSGAGKGTLIERVLPRFPDLAVAVSATTRPQRPGEQDGVHYYFLTRAEFDRRIEGREFLEWVDYVGNRYGTLLSEIDRLRERATESTGEIGGRIETARRQLAEQGEFDYVVENDDRDRAASRLAAIVERELAAATMASR